MTNSNDLLSGWYNPYSRQEVKVFDPKKDAVAKTLFFTERGRKRVDAPYREGPTEILAGMWSTDPQVLAFKRNLAQSATDRFYNPSNVDDRGRISGSGFRSNAQGLRYVSGFGQDPSTWPLVDNTALRESMGLINSAPGGLTEMIIRSVFRCFFRDLVPQPLKFRKGTSTMWPFYRQDVAFKKELALYVLSVMDKVGMLWKQGKFLEAFELYNMAAVTDAVYRLQSNDGVSDDGKVPKDRPVADMEFAVSGGRKGERRPSDRTFTGHALEHELKGFFRQRRRTAYGMSASINYTLAIIAQSVRESIYRRYPKTYHHTTRRELETHVRSCKAVIAVDVAQHDQLWPLWMKDIAREELLAMGFPEWWVAIYYYASFASIFVTGVGSQEPNLLLGDWRNPNVRMGLASGTSFTDLDGSWLMTSTYIESIVTHIAPSMVANVHDQKSCDVFVDSFLKWELPIALKDKSDDALMCCLDDIYTDGFDQYTDMLKDRPEDASSIMRLELEHGTGYLGNIILFPDSKAISDAIVVGNPLSYLVNQFAPEYGIQSGVRDRSRVKRPYPGLAWASYDDVYGSIPIYGELKDLVEKEYFDVYGTSYAHMRNEMLEQDKQKLAQDLKSLGQALPFESLTSIELEILQDPDRAEWKFASTDYRPEIINLSFRGIPLEEVTPFFNRIVPKEVQA